MKSKFWILLAIFPWSLICGQQNMLIEYFQVPNDEEQKYRVMQNSIAREHHQNLLDYREIDAWYHYKNNTDEIRDYNYIVVTIFPDKEAFESRNVLLHFEKFLVKRTWYEVRPIIQAGMAKAPEGTSALVEYMDMTSDIGTLEAYLSRNIKSELNRRVEDGQLEGYGLFMSSDARFKADEPYLLISYNATSEFFPQSMVADSEQGAYHYKGADFWRLMYAVTRN